MKLHTNKEDFYNDILVTSDNTNIAPGFIEKDYWISLVLKRLSESKYVDSVVFKGGTSLSKGHKLINRFSEDIDLPKIVNFFRRLRSLPIVFKKPGMQTHRA